MVRRIFLTSMLVLLASCAQELIVDPVLDAPTVVSTESADGATHVATVSDGSVFVLGYRNGAESADSLGYTSEFYVSHFDVMGKLKWLTLLPSEGYGEDDLHGLVVANSAVYALIQSDVGRTVYLHKLQFDGTLLWSRAILETTFNAFNLLAAPNGQLYLSRHTTDDKNLVTALDTDGVTLWEKEIDDGVLHATGADSSVYVGGFDYLEKNYTLRKYSPDGTLLWSQKLEPRVSKPQGELNLGPFTEVVVQGNKVYLTMEYLYSPSGPSGNVMSNTEVRRYSADGEALWSQLLYPEEAGGPGDTYTYNSTSPIGVAPSGALYLLYDDDVDTPSTKQVLRFSSEGQLTRQPFNTHGDEIKGFALTQARIIGDTSENLTVAYAVGVSRNLPCGSGMCPYSDASVVQYTIDDKPSPEDAFLYPQWFAR